MRKWITLLVLACLFLFVSGVALADNPTGDGVQATAGTANLTIEKTGYRDENGPRRIWPVDTVVGDQSATVKVFTEAFIPCYLEMTFKGNDINASLKSWGAGSAALANYTRNISFIAFNPAIGGYVDSNWNYMTGSHGNLVNGAPGKTGGQYFEVAPGPGVFIRACDTFEAKIWSNLDYKYSVSLLEGALKQSGAADLPVFMRTALNGGDYGAQVELSASLTDVIPSAAALTESTVLHQFKVPFDRLHEAGVYTGTLQFVAATL